MRLIQGDCLIEMKQIPDGSVNLVFVDPPYNIGKAEWDKIDNYLEWCAEWIGECERVLKPNGALWISHSKPLVLTQLSGLIKGRGLRNWITWDKFFGKSFFYVPTRSWEQMAEYLIYHADEGEWAGDWSRYGEIWDSLAVARNGRSVQELSDISGLPTSQVSHYFRRDSSGWCMPTQAQADAMLLNIDCCELTQNRRETQDANQHLRYTFNNPGKMSSVWQIPPAKANFHATPKPEELMRRIVLATSNEGDLVLDPMMGSGTTGVVCQATGREFIGIELDEKYFKLAQKRIKDASAQMTMDLE